MVKVPIYLAWLAALVAILVGDTLTGPCLVAAGCFLGIGIPSGGVAAFDSIGVGARLNQLAGLMAAALVAIGIAWTAASW
jgi:hypothetical protein